MFNFFKKIRFLLRLVVAFWQTHKKIILLAFFLGIIIANFLPKLTSLIRREKSQKIGLVGKYTLETLPHEVLAQISQGLTAISEDGSAAPALASSWEVKNNGKICRFTLKSNLFWHDGLPVTTADINYNFTDVSAQKLDEKTIEFELKELFSPFPTVVSRPLFKEGLIGAGNYKVKSVKRNGQIVEKLVLAPAKNSGQALVYKFYPTEAMAKIAFKLGEIDVINDLSTVGELEEWPYVNIDKRVKNNQFAAIIFNTEKGIFSQKSIRQALAYGLKKDWPNRAFGPINPNSWAYNVNLKSYQFDLDKAREFLQKGLGDQSLEEIKITLTTFPNLFSLAEEIAGDWQKLGLETQIEVVNVIPQDFEAFLVIEDIFPDPDQYLLWHSTQVSNLSHFKSPQIDKLLEDGRKTLDQEARREIYLDFQRFLVEDAPVIFLYHPTAYTVSRK